MKLRLYQEELVSKVNKAYEDGYQAPCIVLGCGGGKSVITAEFAKQSTSNGKRVLFIVHRKELVDQIKNTFEWWGVDMSLCDVMMVQTLSRKLEEVSPDFYNFMIVDENHHSLANTYKKIFTHFPCKRLGVTATPIRLNGDGLGDVNDILIEGVTTEWLIENNFLAPYEYYAPRLVNTNELHIKRGDFVNLEIDEMMNTNIIWGDCIKHYDKIAKGKKTIVYCHSIKASKEVAERFQNAGYESAHIDATTKKKERKQLIQDFSTGKITILTNVDLFGEGLDIANCECVILLRPTMSLTLHIQQSMRSMRYKKEKKAIIIDHVGNCFRHGLPDDEREWSLSKKEKNATDNIKGKKTIFICEDCYRISKLTEVNNQICPFCGHKKRKKNRAEKKTYMEAELIGIAPEFVVDKALTYRYEECDTFEKFIVYGEEKGYLPQWAYIEWNSYSESTSREDDYYIKRKSLTYNYWELDTHEKFKVYAEEKGYNPRWADIKWNAYIQQNNQSK